MHKRASLLPENIKNRLRGRESRWRRRPIPGEGSSDRKRKTFRMFPDTMKEVCAMSMAIRPGYVNPLTTMKEHVWNRNSGKPAGRMQGGEEDQVQKLQVKQQQLLTGMLLIKSSGTDGGSDSKEQLEKMETKLEQTSHDLRSARMDAYEKGRDDQESAGIYQVKTGRRF